MFCPISVHNLPRRRTLNVDRSNEGKWLYTKKAKCRRYPAQTITGADYADDIELLVNVPTQAECLLLSLETAAGAIGLHVKGDISTLNGGSLKLVDKFTYLRSSVSSTENEFHM